MPARERTSFAWYSCSFTGGADHSTAARSSSARRSTSGDTIHGAAPREGLASRGVTTHRIAVIAGDGIGTEVIAAGIAAARRALEVTGTSTLATTDLDWSCERYAREGSMMPSSGLRILAQHDAIFLGAVGFPGVPDHVSLWGLLIPIRQGFDLYVNLRPVRVLEGIPSPLRAGTPESVDMLFVRENTEGEYAGVGGRYRKGTADEVAMQTAVYSRRGVERIARYAFERARERRKKVASVTKSNAIQYTAVLWDEVVAEVATDFPDVQLTSYLVDAMAARMITHPQSLDVVVASNLYGDILTDIGGALQGSLGLAASANLDPTRRNPSLFEPVHGSAPDIAGKGIADPLATVWAAALMLDHLGERDASGLVMRALERVAREGPRAADLGGHATTAEVADAVVRAIGDRRS
ncbi:MAG: tartrate dehydrogenase [Chloroflexota bacterium]|nr:tartrate dehydrogenase [Chloroflexota bacterium]